MKCVTTSWTHSISDRIISTDKENLSWWTCKSVFDVLYFLRKAAKKFFTNSQAKIYREVIFLPNFPSLFPITTLFFPFSPFWGGGGVDAIRPLPWIRLCLYVLPAKYNFRTAVQLRYRQLLHVTFKIFLASVMLQVHTVYPKSLVNFNLLSILWKYTRLF